jgi:hypothetical protein
VAERFARLNLANVRVLSSLFQLVSFCDPDQGKELTPTFGEELDSSLANVL